MKDITHIPLSELGFERKDNTAVWKHWLWGLYPLKAHISTKINDVKHSKNWATHEYEVESYSATKTVTIYWEREKIFQAPYDHFKGIELEKLLTELLPIRKRLLEHAEMRKKEHGYEEIIPYLSFNTFWKKLIEK